MLEVPRSTALMLAGNSGSLTVAIYSTIKGMVDGPRIAVSVPLCQSKQARRQRASVPMTPCTVAPHDPGEHSPQSTQEYRIAHILDVTRPSTYRITARRQ